MKTDEAEYKVDYSIGERYLIERCRKLRSRQRRDIVRYISIINTLNKSASNKRKRNVDIVRDADGNNIVVINDIKFKGKRSLDWKEVREYLKDFVGDVYTILSTGEAVYIGADFPKEYSGSKYTVGMRGANAKAKANATTGIPELIEIANGKHHRENIEEKHSWNAKNGWYRYDSRFALPVYGESGDIERYNLFHASILIRHSNDGKMYLYDVIDIKKETSNPLESKTLLGKKPISFCI